MQLTGYKLATYDRIPRFWHLNAILRRFLAFKSKVFMTYKRNYLILNIIYVYKSY